MCTHTPENQQCLGLPQKLTGQQVERSDSGPLLHSLPSGEQYPCLETLAQKGLTSVKVGLQEGHEDTRGLKHLSLEDKRAGVLQTGDEKTPERPHCSLTVLEGTL